MEWVQSFYLQQFFMMKDEGDNDYVKADIPRTIEQYGKEFTTVLELGAGMGYFSKELALHGKDVTTIEYVEHLVEYAKKHNNGTVNSLHGDFYTIKLPKKYDCVLYIDGFGIGEDRDQLKLLKRIYNWLEDDGYALIDIYEPNYWKTIYKEPMQPTSNADVVRQYQFDEQTCRLLDIWWHSKIPNETYTQSLKCYSVKDIEALCKEANLQIISYFPGGAMDYNSWKYTEYASLDYCISYRIKLKKI